MNTAIARENDSIGFFRLHGELVGAVDSITLANVAALIPPSGAAPFLGRDRCPLLVSAVGLSSVEELSVDDLESMERFLRSILWVVVLGVPQNLSEHCSSRRLALIHGARLAESSRSR